MGSAQVQGRLWGAAATDWARLIEPLMTPLFEAVLDELRIGSETRLLDAGCGSGLALQLAHKREATVTGLDASAGLLEVARERVPTADLREGDLEDLPFPDGAFNAVTAFSSVQYAANPVAALRELRRVAAPDAEVAVATWAPAERCETGVVLAALGNLLPPSPGAGGPFALSAPGTLEGLVTAAGLTPGRTGEVPTPFSYPDLDTAVRAIVASGPARRAVEHAGLEAATETLRAAFAESRQPDGSYHQNNAFRYVISTP
jgi:SAM-dependent methyltransferase